MEREDVKVQLKEETPGFANASDASISIQSCESLSEQAESSGEAAHVNVLNDSTSNAKLQKRVRPNFWIPILYVFSFVIPFPLFILICINANSIPGFRELTDLLKSHGVRLVLYNEAQFGIAALALVSLPILVGVLTAYLLYKNARLKMKFKLPVWAATMLALCLIEYVISAVITAPLK